MSRITLRVLDGSDRGTVYEDLPVPVTIGREEGNTVQLNDERISRFHIKIQDDQEKVVLTDLESTNGTRVNGEETQLRILRYGDLIHVGRSVLLYGTRAQIAGRLEELRANGAPIADDLDPDELARRAEDRPNDESELQWSEEEELRSTLHIPSPPDVPVGLSPAQAAQFSEILEYLHLRVRVLIQAVAAPKEGESVEVAFENWQELLDVQSLLAEYLRKIGEPDAE